MDAVSALRTMERKYVFDIVYMDPPYGKGLETEVLEYLKDSSVITQDTLIIIETNLDADISLYECQGHYTVSRQKKYKTNQHIFLQKK